MSAEAGSTTAQFDSAETSTALASAAPVRVVGTRARAGNAMGRTRAGILDATGRAVERYGVRRATMSDVASVAGIAKGTLYNHFRTKNDLLTAAIAAGIVSLADECVALAEGRGEPGLTRALRHAAETLSAHPAFVRVAAEEPAELVRLLLPGPHGAWPVARTAVGRVVAAAFPAAPVEVDAESIEPADPVASAVSETVLRWLVTFTGAPGVPAETSAGAALLAHAIASALST